MRPWYADTSSGPRRGAFVGSRQSVRRHRRWFYCSRIRRAQSGAVTSALKESKNGIETDLFFKLQDTGEWLCRWSISTAKTTTARGCRRSETFICKVIRILCWHLERAEVLKFNFSWNSIWAKEYSVACNSQFGYAETGRVRVPVSLFWHPDQWISTSPGHFLASSTTTTALFGYQRIVNWVATKSNSGVNNNTNLSHEEKGKNNQQKSLEQWTRNNNSSFAVG